MTIKPNYLSDVFQGFCEPLNKQAHGNNALIFLVKPNDSINEYTLQKISLNNTQTTHVFVQKAEKPNDHSYNIRWWKNGFQIKRCGHGTMAAAACIFSTNNLTELQFKTASSELISVFNDRPINLSESEDIQKLSIRFKPILINYHPNNTLLKDTKLDKHKYRLLPDSTSVSNSLPVHTVGYSTSKEGYLLLQTKDIKQLKSYQPDFEKIKKIDNRAFIVFSNELYSKEGLIIFRYFAPQYNNNEDSATGSAAAILAQYFGTQFNIKKINLFQASKKGAVMTAYHESNNLLVCGEAKISPIIR